MRARKLVLLLAVLSITMAGCGAPSTPRAAAPTTTSRPVQSSGSPSAEMQPIGTSTAESFAPSPPTATAPATGVTQTPEATPSLEGSPTGVLTQGRTRKEIAFVQSGALYTVPPGGEKKRRLTGGRIYSPAWSPAGRAIAYIRPVGSGSLVLLEPGSGPKVLAVGGVTQLAWSPDGEQIAYTRTRDTNRDGTLFPDQDASEVRVVTVEDGNHRAFAPGFDPAWTPDGKGVLLSTPGKVVGGFREKNELRLYTPAGQLIQTIARTADVPNDLSQFGTPFVAATRLLRYGTISPDGKTVAFSALGGTGVLATRRLEGGEVQVQDTIVESGFGRVTWQPGGSSIAYEVPTPSGVTQVTVLDVKTGNRFTLGDLQEKTNYTEPAWSPDGAALALVRSRIEPGSPKVLVTVPSRGGQLRVLLEGDVESPSWGLTSAP